MKNHKASLVLLIALGSLVALPIAAPAADAAPSGEKPAAQPARRDPIQVRLDATDKAVTLSDAQKKEVKTIFQAESKAIADVRAKTDLSREEQRSKIAEIRTKTADKMKKVLSQEQMEKYEKFLKDQAQRRGNRGNRSNQPTPAPR